jgi:ornithine decarboxylase
MATQRVLDFLATRRPEGPCLVVDLDVVRDNFRAFEKALPDSKIYYAVKANPAPEILRLLAAMGSSFDTASVAEVEMALDAGATADRISFGNTIKKERDIAKAYALGIRLYAVDSVEEVEKVSRAAPGARVFCPQIAPEASAEGMSASASAYPLALPHPVRWGAGADLALPAPPAAFSQLAPGLAEAQRLEHGPRL